MSKSGAAFDAQSHSSLLGSTRVRSSMPAGDTEDLLADLQRAR